MATTRCFLVGKPAVNIVKMEQLPVERLFPFEQVEFDIYTKLDDARHIAKKTQKHPSADVPIFIVEVNAELINNLIADDKAKMKADTDKFIKYCSIKPLHIQSIDNVFINKADGTDGEYRFRKPFYKLGLSHDTKPYDECWQATEGEIDAKMKALLKLYKKGPAGGFFRNHKKEADKILEIIKQRKPLDIIYKTIFETLCLAKEDVLNGEYAPALRVLMLHIERELERRRLAAFSPAAAAPSSHRPS